MGQASAIRKRLNTMKKLLAILLLFYLPSQGKTSPIEGNTKEQKGVLFGAYMDFGETEDAVTLEGIEDFEKLAGKRPAIIASSSYWGEQSFPKKNLALIDRHGATPLIFWSPWDKPYDQNKGDK